MMQLGLIGKGIQRTQVHLLHQALGELCGIEVSYRLLDAELQPELTLAERVTTAIAEGYRGVNVTHPFKAEVTSLVSTSGAVPAGLASYNTLIFQDGDIRGENTDYSGFKAGFRRTFAQRKPGRVLLLGSGGVGRSIAFGLAEMAAEQLFLFDKNHAIANSLATVLTDNGYHCSVVGENQLIDIARTAEGIVNATPIGMYQYPGTPLPKDAIASPHWGFDAIYTPMETEFIVDITAAGAQTMNGYELFLNQGVDAFEHFAGVKLDRDEAIGFYLNKRQQML